MASSLVIIPTYNEAENIEKLVRNIFAQQRAFEVLVVDDNSPDGTAALVKNLQEEFKGRVHLLERPGKNGLGTAYIAGFKWALNRDYSYIFEMDADFSHAPNDLVRLYNACAKGGSDLAIGSRYITGVNVVNWPMGRVLMSYIASKYVRFITGMDIADTTAGFICYRRSVLEKINLDKIKFVGYAFQIEMKFKAHLLGFKITEVPVIFVDRTKGTSKMSSSIFSEAVFGVITMKMKSLFKRYDI
ncbi:MULTISPECIES: polyprenol monophosphomannose synthase [unclassified Leeuwenhoekiella]|uniref:polyprenol monophosphomannose synthase n=1 Tax=unclassified Leeuwenhoekiella TaxID=2615029 RepID=UPI000C59190F|nr:MULTISPECIES: polyprenol monophosphomannose synthase [unclassified Leeuwenhoekiella]MAW96818.1 dolichyl-phosphate beta-D-mannosyltransferase [Leeuwenhoekiella sp.]MBA80315.1 dolichyl-phosphate beta-D-mannosyltransferase [Leeuwenhoekiella sp.]|tara:strand:+ start:8713 stop:9444 length:732 start_codon:yes stop_codon:yes gene_type:complete